MTLHDPLARLGPIDIHPLGLFVAIGIIAGYALALWRVLRADLPARQLPGTFLIVVLGSLIAARLGFAATHPGVTHDGAQGVLSLWRGGFSLIAGVGGGAVLLALLTWARRGSFWAWADAVAPAAALGLAIGMMGLPYGGEGWGRPTTGPWFMRVDPALRPLSLIDATRFQPIFAYEAALFAALAVALLALSWSRGRRGRSGSGAVGLTFLAVTAIGYGALRPLTLDASNATLVMQLQGASAGLAAIACALLAVRLWPSRRARSDTAELMRVQPAGTARSSQFSDALRSTRSSRRGRSAGRR